MCIRKKGEVLYERPAELPGGLIGEDKGAVMLAVIVGSEQV